ncbi:hypothetical protein [uncultured Tolumonas sp.]|uniref:hypothetical protein n=1 Tax=uncultured Tolumonas sp. TaxID=263765 RepID=UPI002A0A18D6|nr:hypothetical protein [uncultured Tolumonas sp.]
MSDFDFLSAEAPSATPLQYSHDASQIEAELKGVFTDLFSLVGADSFDANVLGAPHLGSFDLVRKMVNHDGLVLLRGEREEAATRYLYRAWKSGDVQKRGLHFVRTYLQLLFPGESEVKQLWHSKAQPYGQAFIKNEPRDPYWFHFLGEDNLSVNGSWKVGRSLVLDNIQTIEHTPDEADLFLTSRIEILLGLESIASGENSLISTQKSATSGLINIIRAVIPARLVPVFRFWLRFLLAVQIKSSSALGLVKSTRLRYPWGGRVISNETDVKWTLGSDGEIVSLPQPFGSFRLGESRGGNSYWALKTHRIESSTSLASKSSIDAIPIPVVGGGRRLNGDWSLGARQISAVTASLVTKKAEIQKSSITTETTFHDFFTMAFPSTPARIGKTWSLGYGSKLNGEVKISGMIRGGHLGDLDIHQEGIITERTAIYSIDSSIDMRPFVGKKLAADFVTKLRTWDRQLDGSWPLGAESRLKHFKLDGTRLRSRKMRAARRINSFKLSTEEHAGLDDIIQDFSLPLDGSWKVGFFAKPEFDMKISRL